MSSIEIKDVYYLRQNVDIIQGSVDNHTWCNLICPITFRSPLRSIINLTSELNIKHNQTYMNIEGSRNRVIFDGHYYLISITEVDDNYHLFENCSHVDFQNLRTSCEFKGYVYPLINHDKGGSTLDTCSICLDDYVGNNKITQLDCGHCFHSKCLTEWLFRTNLCPMCRFQLKSTTYYYSSI